MRPGCRPWMGAGVGQELSSLQLGWGAWGVGELSPLPLSGSFPGAPVPTCPVAHLAAATAPWAGSSPGSRVGCPGPARGPLLGCSIGMVQWCQPCSQNWMGQGRAEEEPGTFGFHTWETVKSQVATPAFVWYFQKNPAGPGIPGHNLLWKNKIIKYQSL